MAKTTHKKNSKQVVFHSRNARCAYCGHTGACMNGRKDICTCHKDEKPPRGFQGKEFDITIQAPSKGELDKMIKDVRSFARKVGANDFIKVLESGRDPDAGYKAIIVGHNNNFTSWIKQTASKMGDKVASKFQSKTDRVYADDPFWRLEYNKNAGGKEIGKDSKGNPIYSPLWDSLQDADKEKYKQSVPSDVADAAYDKYKAEWSRVKQEASAEAEARAAGVNPDEVSWQKVYIPGYHAEEDFTDDYGVPHKKGEWIQPGYKFVPVKQHLSPSQIRMKTIGEKYQLNAMQSALREQKLAPIKEVANVAGTVMINTAQVGAELAASALGGTMRGIEQGIKMGPRAIARGRASLAGAPPLAMYTAPTNYRFGATAMSYPAPRMPVGRGIIQKASTSFNTPAAAAVLASSPAKNLVVPGLKRTPAAQALVMTGPLDSMDLSGLKQGMKIKKPKMSQELANLRKRMYGETTQ